MDEHENRNQPLDLTAFANGIIIPFKMLIIELSDAKVIDRNLFAAKLKLLPERAREDDPQGHHVDPLTLKVIEAFAAWIAEPEREPHWKPVVIQGGGATDEDGSGKQ